ncbi:hypothetical protein DFO70_106414 [Cytobacillus firmus]|uniref:Uncharacterized protein n=2 Tax=Cytobacillus TaxID=2675230 RepID=A0A366JZ63_CYTFI|nr:hypothetical protein DFO70_106414 [Cytobacillus firmus]TDX42881.1 hypothetical protein DFO72_106414 [Cytobacillus oceanisediminis]
MKIVSSIFASPKELQEEVRLDYPQGDFLFFLTDLKPQGNPYVLKCLLHIEKI